MTLRDGFGSTEPVLVADALRGYRSWHIDYSGQLYGIYVPPPWSIWHAGVNTAGCFVHGKHDESPSRHCACGFYSYYSQDISDLSWDLESKSRMVTGAVRLTDRVILGTKGSRAEKAEIEALVLSLGARNKRDSGDFIKRYYPDVPIYSSWKKLCRDFPPSDLSQLLGPEAAPRPKVSRPSWWKRFIR